MLSVFLRERWGCSCVTEMFTWRFGKTQNCHQDKNIPKQNRKLLNGIKSPTEGLCRKPILVAIFGSYQNQNISGFKSKM